MSCLPGDGLARCRLGWCDGSRSGGFGAAHVEREWRVLVGHEGGVGGDPDAPAVHAEDEVVDGLWVASGDREDDDGDEGQDADESAAGPAEVVVVGLPGEVAAAAGEE